MVQQRGHMILDLPAQVGAAVSTYLAGANRNGMLPFRMVILDAAGGTGVGTASRATIKYPAAAHANGEKIFGVSMTVDTLQKDRGGYVSDLGYYPTDRGRSMQVRVMGVAPVMTDSTTAGTPILPGDFVTASQTANNDGLAKKGALTNNALSAGQHCVGLSLSRVAIANGVALTLIERKEA